MQLLKDNDSTRAAAARGADRRAYRLPLSLLHLGSFVSGKKEHRNHFALLSSRAWHGFESKKLRHGFLWVRRLCYLPERSVQEPRTHLDSTDTSPFSLAFCRDNTVPLKYFQLPAKSSGSSSIPHAGTIQGAGQMLLIHPRRGASTPSVREPDFTPQPLLISPGAMAQFWGGTGTGRLFVLVRPRVPSRVRSRTGVPVSPRGAEPWLSHPARRSRVRSGGRDAAPSAHRNQLCCQFLPVCNTKRCQLPVTMKLQFRGAPNMSGNKALTLQAVSRALRIAQAPLLEVLFLLVNVGRKNHPQPPANTDVVETACEINGNGSFPLQGASSKRLETRSLLLPPARAATCERRLR